MDAQSQMTRPYGHHPEEEDDHEKGVLKKVKEKAKKIKNSLTKHGHGHEHDQDVEEEEDEYGAPEEIVPPGTRVFPVVSSDYSRPVEPEHGLYGHEAASHPLRVLDMSEREESREAHHMPIDTPASLLSATEDVTRTFALGEDEYLGGQRKVNVGRPKGLEEDPAAPGGGSSCLPNYQSKVTDPTKEGNKLGRNTGSAGVPGIVESLGRMKMGDESPRRKSGREFEREELPARSHEFDHKTEAGLKRDSPRGLGNDSTGFGSALRARPAGRREESGIRKDSPTRLGSGSIAGLGEAESGMAQTGTHDQFSPELSPPKERKDFDSKSQVTRDEPQGTKPSTYTEKIASATTDKNAGTVAHKLTPVFEKVKETGSAVMTKLPFSGGGGGGGGGLERQQDVDKGVSTRDYLAEKLKPGEEDKALSEVIAEKLHLGGGGGEKKTTTTKEVEVTVEKIPSHQIPEEIKHSKAIAEEAKGGAGMVGKLKGAVTSWLGGGEEEVEPMASDTAEESSQSLGSTVGTMGFSDSGAVSTQRGLQGPGK